MPRKTDPQHLPAINRFAETIPGDFEARFTAVAEHAFMTYAILLTAADLRTVCAGGRHSTAQRVVKALLESIHKRVSRRLSASAIKEWIDAGMEPTMSDLSPRERMLASAFLQQLQKHKAQE